MLKSLITIPAIVCSMTAALAQTPPVPGFTNGKQWIKFGENPEQHVVLYLDLSSIHFTTEDCRVAIRIFDIKNNKVIVQKWAFTAEGEKFKTLISAVYEMPSGKLLKIVTPTEEFQEILPGSMAETARNIIREVILIELKLQEQKKQTV